MRVFFLIVGLVMPFMSSAQGTHPILKNFIAEQRNETVYLQWTIDKGQTCNDIHIERAGQDKRFERIGLISGVCGSADYAVVYYFTDSVPYPNQTNYYRLEMGTQGYTSILSVKTYITGDDQYLLLGNPASHKLHIVFENTKERLLTIYNLQGHELMKEQHMSNYVELDIMHLPGGLYLFTATEESGNRIHGKFVKTNEI